MKKKYDLRLYSGVVGVAILWIAMITAMLRAGLRLVDSRPLSYLGVNSATARMFSIGLLTSSLLFVMFAFYLRRVFGVKNRFLAYFLIGQAGQVTAAITPYGSNSNYRFIHTIAAYTLAVSLPLLIREFYMSQKYKSEYWFYRRLFYIELIMFVLGISIFSLTKGVAPLGEALPAIGFHAWILAVTFSVLRRHLFLEQH